MRALTEYLHGHSSLDAHTSQRLREIFQKSGFDPKYFRGVALDNLLLFEEEVEQSTLIYDFDFEKENCVRELARRSVGKFQTTLVLLRLRFKNYINNTSDNDKFIELFRCPS